MNGVTPRILQAALRVLADQDGAQVAVSDIAREAGLSRGTIYNNIDKPDLLFEQLCETVKHELRASLVAAIAPMGDPAERVAAIIRLCVQRVHDDPDWGRFLARYAMVERRLGRFWVRLPAEELRDGRICGRFDFRPEQELSLASAMGGLTFSAIVLVLNGRSTWRQAGSDTAEMMLRSLGLPVEEARRLATAPLAPLPRIDFAEADAA
ncbi:TetR family transcriptional regulator [Aquicoccus sp. SCR17]|nr:TetR family transcriptional regulator [Carideicomes alvinocaridis]